MLGQDQPLRVGREHFADGVLKLATGLYPPLHVLHPIFGDVLDVFLASNQEGERPDGMTGIPWLGAVTGRLATAQVAEAERTRQQIVWDGEATQEWELPLSK